MKKLLIALFGLLLAGAGCIPVANAPVDGKWKLAFDLPSGWVMVLPYADSTVALSDQVKRTTGEVWLQSSNEKLCASQPVTCPAAGLVDGGTVIKVSLMDSHRVLPQTLKDLGKGFYRDEGFCASATVPTGHACVDPFFLKTATGNYYFQVDGDGSAAEKIIKSAKVVTHYTDLQEIKVTPN